MAEPGPNFSVFSGFTGRSWEVPIANHILLRVVALRHFVLRANEFVRLPFWIGRLGALEGFDAGNNKFDLLPESIGSCTSLRNLKHAKCDWD